MATYSNLVTHEFVKETRTAGVVTSLTIKLVAYDGDNNMTTITGDGGYLTATDSTWDYLIPNGEVVYDWDNCTSIASQSLTYTVPEADQTSLAQSKTHPHNASEQLEYQSKRDAWRTAYQELEAYDDAKTALQTAVAAL